MKANKKLRVASQAFLILTVGAILVSTTGCRARLHENKLVGRWVNPLMEYDFRPDGTATYAFWTSDGPRFVQGIWWVTSGNGSRSTIHLRRMKPSPRKTYTMTCFYEKDGLIQVSKPRGKFRLTKTNRAVDGSFKGPWSNRVDNPYWHSVPKR